MAALDLVAFGDVLVDEYFTVDAPPPSAAKCAAGYRGTWAGGMAGNVAALAAGGGMRAAVVASVGRDRWAEPLIGELARRSVDVGWIRRRDAPTGRTVVVLQPGGERLLLVAPGAHGAPPLDALAEVLAARPRLVYTAALDTASALRIAEAARAAGVGTAADIEAHEARRDPARARRLAGACRLVACSEATAARLGPRPAGAVRLLLRGAAGLAVETDEGTWTGVPPAGAVVDTTGGGDAATAAACAGLLGGDGPQAIGESALRAAAAVVARVGVRSRLEAGDGR